MEPDNVFPFICLSIPVLIIVGLLILFFIIRGIVRRGKRKLGFQQGSGDFIRRQLTNLDQASGAAPSDSQDSNLQPTYRAPTREPEFDLNTAEPPARKTIPMDEHTSPTACPACGAPRSIGQRNCTFCGHDFA